MLVSFHSGACCAGRKHPTNRKKICQQNQHCPPVLWGVGAGWAPSLQIYVGRALSHQCSPLSSHPALLLPQPAFQPFPFCGGERFFYLPQSHFSSFPWTIALRKRSSWHPAPCLILYLQQPNKMRSRMPHSPSSWVVGLFVVLFCWWR